MAAPGGKRPGAGRKKGGQNKRTKALLKLVNQKAIEGGITPLEYMLKVMRDRKADLARRDQMAVAAAPFVHPKLSSVEAKTTIDLSGLTDEQLELAAKLSALIATGGSHTGGAAQASGA